MLAKFLSLLSEKVLQSLSTLSTEIASGDHILNFAPPTYFGE